VKITKPSNAPGKTNARPPGWTTRKNAPLMPGVWALLELTDALEISSETGNENYAKPTSVTFQGLGTMVVCSPRITRKEENDNNK